MTYPNDIFDGQPRAPKVISSEETIAGSHQGSIYVQDGAHLHLIGMSAGTLTVEAGGRVDIELGGRNNGTLNVARGASVSVRGQQNGTLNIDGEVHVERGGRAAGSCNNYGRFVVGGEQGGVIGGPGITEFLPGSTVKQPVQRDGMSVYEWRD